jgi:hypothetical protein
MCVLFFSLQAFISVKMQCTFWCEEFMFYFLYFILVWFFPFTTWSQLYFTVKTIEYAGRENLL